jgi:hypothetical protein
MDIVFENNDLSNLYKLLEVTYPSATRLHIRNCDKAIADYVKEGYNRYELDIKSEFNVGVKETWESEIGTIRVNFCPLVLITIISNQHTQKTLKTGFNYAKKFNYNANNSKQQNENNQILNTFADNLNKLLSDFKNNKYNTDAILDSTFDANNVESTTLSIGDANFFMDLIGNRLQPKWYQSEFIEDLQNRKAWLIPIFILVWWTVKSCK